MIKLKYTTYVKILVIIVIKLKIYKLIKSFPKEVRFQIALKNP